MSLSSVGLSVCQSVCLSVVLRNTADGIWMLFGVVGQLGQIVGVGNCPTTRGNFVGGCGALHCN